MSAYTCLLAYACVCEQKNKFDNDYEDLKTVFLMFLNIAILLQNIYA